MIFRTKSEPPTKKNSLSAFTDTIGHLQNYRGACLEFYDLLLGNFSAISDGMVG
jgi:hypothetical protein